MGTKPLGLAMTVMHIAKPVLETLKTNVKPVNLQVLMKGGWKGIHVYRPVLIQNVRKYFIIF